MMLSIGFPSKVYESRVKFKSTTSGTVRCWKVDLMVSTHGVRLYPTVYEIQWLIRSEKGIMELYLDG